MVIILVLLTLSCTKTDHDTKIFTVPTANAIRGPYAVSFAGRILTVGTIGEAISFAVYPCRIPGSIDTIGGGYLYDPATGAFDAELKSLEGFVSIVISGNFTNAKPAHFIGNYQVRTEGLPCQVGTLDMISTKP